MKTILVILGILLSLNLFSQKVGYFYDDAGNRVQRKLCLTCRTSNPNVTEPAKREITVTVNDNYKFDVNVLPNPTKGKLEVKIVKEGVEENQCHLLVYDNFGREIINKQQPLTSFNIDLTDKKPGIYFIKIRIAEEIREWKIIKE
jgi:type IX secretion system substrate protein